MEFVVAEIQRRIDRFEGLEIDGHLEEIMKLGLMNEQNLLFLAISS